MSDADLSIFRPLPAMRGKTGRSKGDHFNAEFGICYFCATIVWGPEVAKKYGPHGTDYPRLVSGAFVEAHSRCFNRWCEDGRPVMNDNTLYQRPR